MEDQASTQALGIIDVAAFRKANNRPGTQIVRLSPPDELMPPGKAPLIVRVALDDTETLVMQDRLPNPLRKPAIDAAAYYEETETEANTRDPETGDRKGFDPDRLKQSLEWIDTAISILVIEPEYVLMKDAGKGAVPDGKLCLKDFGEYERSACIRLLMGGLEALERFHSDRSRAATNADGVRDENAPERVDNSAGTPSMGAPMVGRGAISADAPNRSESDGGTGAGTPEPRAEPSPVARQGDASGGPVELGIAAVAIPANASA